MQGIKEIAGLIFWVDNRKSKYLKAAIAKERKIPKEKQLINNQLNLDNKDDDSLNQTQELS